MSRATQLPLAIRERFLAAGLRHEGGVFRSAGGPSLRVSTGVATGVDPAAERETYRKAPTVAQLCDRYVAQHVAEHNKPSTEKEFRRLVEKRIKPALGRLKAVDVTRQHVIKLHRGMRATPRQANQTLAVLSKLFNLAEFWGARPDGSNPCRHIKRYAEGRRERFLSEDELSWLGTALADAEGAATERPGVINAIRLLALTGCRLGEILGLRWNDVDFGTGALYIRDAKAGGRVQTIGAPALALLDDMPRAGEWVVFSTSADRPLPVSTIENAWARLRKRAGLSDVRIHDLRHTVGTYAAQAGANAFLVRDKLGHKTLSMTGRYVGRDAAPLRVLSDKVERRIAAALAGDPGEIVPFDMRRNKGSTRATP